MPNFSFSVCLEDEVVCTSSVLPLSSQFDRLRKLYLQAYHFRHLPALSPFLMTVPQNSLWEPGRQCSSYVNILSKDVMLLSHYLRSYGRNFGQNKLCCLQIIWGCSHLWKQSSQTLLFRQCHLDQLVQGCVPMGIEYLHRWRLHNLSEQPVSVFDYPLGKKGFGFLMFK